MDRHRTTDGQNYGKNGQDMDRHGTTDGQKTSLDRQEKRKDNQQKWIENGLNMARILIELGQNLTENGRKMG